MNRNKRIKRRVEDNKVSKDYNSTIKKAAKQAVDDLEKMFEKKWNAENQSKGAS